MPSQKHSMLENNVCSWEKADGTTNSQFPLLKGGGHLSYLLSISSSLGLSLLENVLSQLVIILRAGRVLNMFQCKTNKFQRFGSWGLIPSCHSNSLETWWNIRCALNRDGHKLPVWWFVLVHFLPQQDVVVQCPAPIGGHPFRGSAWRRCGRVATEGTSAVEEVGSQRVNQLRRITEPAVCAHLQFWVVFPFPPLGT